MILLPSEWNSIHGLIYIYIAQFFRNCNTDSVRGPIIYSSIFTPCRALTQTFETTRGKNKQPNTNKNVTQSKGRKGFREKNTLKHVCSLTYSENMHPYTNICMHMFRLYARIELQMMQIAVALFWTVGPANTISRLPKSCGQKLNPQSLELGSPVSSVSY